MLHTQQNEWLDFPQKIAEKLSPSGPNIIPTKKQILKLFHIIQFPLTSIQTNIAPKNGDWVSFREGNSLIKRHR